MVNVSLHSEALYHSANAPQHLANQWHVPDGPWVPTSPYTLSLPAKPRTLQVLNLAGGIPQSGWAGWQAHQQMSPSPSLLLKEGQGHLHSGR